MKKRIKQILSLLSVAVILISTLPISASAVFQGTGKSLTVNFGFDCNIYNSVVSNPSDVSSAMKSLVFEYNDGQTFDRQHDYNGSSFSVTVYDKSDASWDIRIINPSFYEFKFDLRVFSPEKSMGVFSIPAATVDSNGNVVPGVYYLDLVTVFGVYPDASKITFWLKPSALPPVYHPPEVNDGYTMLYLVGGKDCDVDLGSYKITAPPGTYGPWTVSIQYLENDGIIDVPEYINGKYKLDWDIMPETVTVYPGVYGASDMIYYNELNTNYALINLYTGSTLHSSLKVYADKDVIGSWTKPLFELEKEGFVSIPDQLNGYLLDKQNVFQTLITVDPDKVNTYNLYYDTKLNSNYAVLNFYVGSTLKFSEKVYAPANTVGSWSMSLDDLYNSGYFNMPDELDGYKFDWQNYGLDTITVDPDNINSYNFKYDIKLNTSYTIIYAVTPNGRKELYRLYAPQGWVGDYVYELRELAHDESIIPPFFEGYTFNTTVSPEYVTVYSDRVTEVELQYTDIGADKTIKVNYYDQNGKIINQVEYRVSSLGSSFKIPSKDGYLFAPSSVSLTLGLLSESFNVYMIDFTGEREAAYEKGLSEGLSQNQDHFELMLKEAYDKGYEKGYSENSITQEHAAKIRKEYNLFTAFFDGAFGGLLQMYETITNGIAIGGVSLNNVISTAAVAVIVAFLVKVIL